MRVVGSPTLLVYALIALASVACGGGGGSEPAASGGASGAAPTAPAPSSPAPSSPAPTSPGSSASGAIYASAPDVAGCEPGVLSDSEQQRVIDGLNRMRARHGLAAVAHDSTADGSVSAAALMMVANGQLDHSPPVSWNCFSNGGSDGAAQSNLYIRSTTAASLDVDSLDALAALLIDRGVGTLGHRRWMLDPFLGNVSWGRADGQPIGRNRRYMAGALKVIGNGKAALPAGAPQFVAYPHGDYPAELYPAGAAMSFSVLADADRRSANFGSVSFSGASVTLTDESGNTLVVSALADDYGGFGLPNLLSWQTPALRTGERYQIRVEGVFVFGAVRDYAYSLTLR